MTAIMQIEGAVVMSDMKIDKHDVITIPAMSDEYKYLMLTDELGGVPDGHYWPLASKDGREFSFCLLVKINGEEVNPKEIRILEEGEEE